MRLRSREITAIKPVIHKRRSRKSSTLPMDLQRKIFLEVDMKVFSIADSVLKKYMIWNAMIRHPQHALIFSASKNVKNSVSNLLANGAENTPEVLALMERTGNDSFLYLFGGDVSSERAVFHCILNGQIDVAHQLHKPGMTFFHRTRARQYLSVSLSR